MILFILLCTNTASALWYNTTTLDDTYTTTGSRDYNAGNDTAMLVGNYSGDQRIYIKSNLDNISAGSITTAKLRLYSDSSNCAGELNIAETTAWSESTITYNNQPAPTIGLGTFTPPCAVGWIEIDVTYAVQRIANGSYTNYGWVIYDMEYNSSDSAFSEFFSSENPSTQYAPSLNINYTGFGLDTPTNGSEIIVTYPPMTIPINFSWSGIANAFNIIIAQDNNFNLIITNEVVSTNYYTRSLSAGNYWWKVRPYNTVTGWYGNYSDVFNFTITAQQTTSGTAIQGTVYELINGVQIPINGARVLIVNNLTTQSYEMVTGTNGYFLFTGLTNSTTYYLRATKSDLYQDSISYYVTTGAGVWTTQNILLEKCVSSYNCYFGTVEQRIYFIYANGTFLTGYPVKIFVGDAVVPLYSLTTDGDGMVSARLTLGTRYQVGIYDAGGTNLITDLLRRYFYPSDDPLDIWIGNMTVTPPDYPTNETQKNFTGRNGTAGGGISAMNGSYLTSQIGLGPLGQGVMVSFITWVVVGAGGPVTVLFTTAILAWLGIVSWNMLFYFIVTAMSIYVLKEM